MPPGDAALTRRVKEAGDHWLVQEKKGRKVFTRRVWAPAPTIERNRASVVVRGHRTSDHPEMSQASHLGAKRRDLADF